MCVGSSVGLIEIFSSTHSQQQGIAILEVDREEFRWISDKPKGQPGTLAARVYPIQPE
jgi:hypothetical protein